MHGHAPHSHHDTGERAPWTILVLLALAQFMVVLDVTVVNVALPSIGTDLGFDSADLPWVVTAYVLFTGGLMLLGGRVADLAGRRRIFLAGLAVFTAASLFSGLAGSPGALIASRAVQGVGAAMLLPSALAIVTTTYGGAQRAVALGVWGALGSAGAAAGVLLGGVLTSALSWEWVFWVNVPVGLAVAFGTLHAVPASAPVPGARGRLDVRGALTLTGGLLTLVYAVQGTEAHGWGSARTLVLLGAAAVLLTAFATGERRAEAPLVPPSLWRVRSLVTGAATMVGATGLLVGAFYLNTLYLQRGLGYSPLEAGLAFLPLALVILAGAHTASRVMPRTGSRALIVGGLALVAAGALVLHGAPDQGSYAADLLPGFLVLGFGTGLTFVSVSVSAMADVGHEQAGLASGLMTTAHEVGAALGVAVLAASGGYADGFAVEAGIAVALALVAAVASPSVRPAAGAAMPAH
jgi:EmrB/QacA subfamily drug resistance transporter